MLQTHQTYSIFAAVCHCRDWDNLDPSRLLPSRLAVSGVSTPLDQVASLYNPQGRVRVRLNTHKPVAGIGSAVVGYGPTLNRESALQRTFGQTASPAKPETDLLLKRRSQPRQFGGCV
ncbi:unnamed protein product [Protopolystoma xenopodis]|uniref:Uncharacterized protein n=1 Tax=Protopolystoma xenopodis TaxID=117903 RepID=A0A448WW80_9PLAT|nr:unnamed protein product [Protopolystoma xenopodis]